MDILFSSIEILLVLVFIVLACVIFTNAVEHLGEQFNLSEGAVGSILAAVGTALPETIVPLVAILGAYFFHTDIEAGKEIGIGAILGAPFLLGTLAFFVTGAAVIYFSRLGIRNREMPVNTTVMFRDIHYFAIAYTIAVLSSFVSYKPLKYGFAVLLLVLYAVYAWKTITKADKSCKDCYMEEIEPLYLTKLINSPESMLKILIFVQFLLSLAGIILLAHLFVEQIKFLSEHLRINPFILSLIITPIATELPEKFNSIIWIKAKKDTLALGNITGAMVFQSCIPTAVGIALTAWTFSMSAWINIIIVYLSVMTVYINIVRNNGILKPSALLSGGFFYLIYLFYVVYKYCIV